MSIYEWKVRYKLTDDGSGIIVHPDDLEDWLELPLGVREGFKEHLRLRARARVIQERKPYVEG